MAASNDKKSATAAVTEQLNFNRGSAVELIACAGETDRSVSETQDLERAIIYLKRELNRLKAEERSAR